MPSLGDKEACDEGLVPQGLDIQYLIILTEEPKLSAPRRHIGRVAALTAVAATLTTPAIAHADDPASTTFTCVGSGTQHYDPGLTLTTRPTTIWNEASFPQCLGGPVTAGTFNFGPFQIESSCLVSAPVGADEIDYTWNDGSTSHFSGHFVVTRPVGELVVSSTGTFTSGRFSGHPVESVITYLAPDPAQCLTDSGVQSVTGALTVVVLPE